MKAIGIAVKDFHIGLPLLYDRKKIQFASRVITPVAHVAAIDGEAGAGNEGGFRAGQIGNHAGDFIGLTISA